MNITKLELNLKENWSLIPFFQVGFSITGPLLSVVFAGSCVNLQIEALALVPPVLPTCNYAYHTHL